MELRVSSQEAAASLDQLLDRVNSGGGGDVVIIERAGVAVGKLVAAGAGGAPTLSDLVAVLRSWPRLNDGWADGVEEASARGNEPATAESPWDR